MKDLGRSGYVRSEPVRQAMMAVRRELFVPETFQAASYADHPLEIGHNQTISAPHMVAIMVEAMGAKEGQKVLEIGGGSGYHAAVIAHVVGPTGHVYTVERIEALAQGARVNLEAARLSDRVTVLVGDGSCGWSEHAPYDRISVACAAPHIPDEMVADLAEGGVLLIPMGSQYIQELTRVTKLGDRTRTERLGGCVFVPLLGKCGH